MRRRAEMLAQVLTPMRPIGPTTITRENRRRRRQNEPNDTNHDELTKSLPVSFVVNFLKVQILFQMKLLVTAKVNEIT